MFGDPVISFVVAIVLFFVAYALYKNASMRSNYSSRKTLNRKQATMRFRKK